MYVVVCVSVKFRFLVVSVGNAVGILLNVVIW